VYCGTCGSDVSPEAAFCPSCGNPISPRGAQQEPSGALPPINNAGGVEELVNGIERQMAPRGHVVICFDLPLMYTRRTELIATTRGTFDTASRELMKTALAEALDTDAYIYAELDFDGEPAACVWHALSSTLFPLSDELATALLTRYDALMPESSLVEITEDAPDVLGG
jgi:hypothetical protein